MVTIRMNRGFLMDSEFLECKRIHFKSITYYTILSHAYIISDSFKTLSCYGKDGTPLSLVRLNGHVWAKLCTFC
jgi:hypothetical protein